jgi:tRNA(fMet)-specific endonuclease VapC
MVNMRILDTNTVSMYRIGFPKLMTRLLAEPIGEITVAIVTVEEQLTGWQTYLRRAKSDTEIAAAYQKLTDTVRTLADMHLITFSEAAIRRYRFLLSLKLNIGGMDLRIAAIALEEDATVITRNLRDFERVPQLKCENWAD